jgi:hypothetical protein
MRALFLTLWLFSLLSSAQGAACRKLVECVAEAEKLLGVKFVYNQKELGQKLELSSPVELTRDNAHPQLGEVLNLFGLAKLPSETLGSWKIIPAREIKFREDLPRFEASKTKSPSLPETHDPHQLEYQAVKGADTRKLARDLRRLLTRSGRIVDLSGKLVIKDSALALRQMLPLLQQEDRPLTAEERKRLDEELAVPAKANSGEIRTGR